MTTRPINTHDINPAAVRMTITGEQSPVNIKPGDSLATFDLPDNDDTQKLLNDYVIATLTLNFKRFAACPNFLFEQMKAVH